MKIANTIQCQAQRHAQVRRILLSNAMTVESWNYVLKTWEYFKNFMLNINEQTRVCKEAYSRLNFSGSLLGKNHQVKFDH
jgi:hypothetical protein